MCVQYIGGAPYTGGYSEHIQGSLVHWKAFIVLDYPEYILGAAEYIGKWGETRLHCSVLF